MVQRGAAWDVCLWLWQGGCIIRAVFLDDIYQAYKRNPALENLMVDPEFAQKLVASEQAWRSVVTKARVPPCTAFLAASAAVPLSRCGQLSARCAPVGPPS